MKLRFLSKLKQFRWSKLLLIWLVFLLIAGVLFAERCGIKYASTNFKIDYLSRTSVPVSYTHLDVYKRQRPR